MKQRERVDGFALVSEAQDFFARLSGDLHKLFSNNFLRTGRVEEKVIKEK